MSFRAIPHDEAAGMRPLDPDMEISESPRRDTGHSRNGSESRHLLPSPKNLFEYSAKTNVRFQGQSSQGGDPRFPHWSWEPQTLRRSRRKWWRDLLVDTLMFAVGLPFFALAAVVVRVNGRVAGTNELNVLEQCIRGAATAFPLIFSIVVGRALVKLASWKLERGAAIGLLEQLMGSRTVGGAILTQFRLQSISLLAVGLVFLWLLSPLGSQAVLRILTTTTSSCTSGANITYFNTRQPSFSGYTSFYDSWFPGFTSLFSASLLASADLKNGTMDLWGNVKIPLFSSLSGSQNSDGWVQVPQDANNTTYASLFGIPISRLPAGNTSFSLESSYLELSCEIITSNVVRDGAKFTNPGLISTRGPFISAQNITNLTPWAIGYLGTDVTALLPPKFFGTTVSLDALPDDVASMKFASGLLLYQDFEGRHNVTDIYCTPSQAYVESNITCFQIESGQSCAVTTQRLSTLPHVPTELTYLSFGQFLNGLTELLPVTTQQINHIDLLQNYIANPDDDTFIQSTQWPTYSSNSTNRESRFLDLPLEDFGVRLGQVINAFLFGSMVNSTEYLTHSSPLLDNSTALDYSDLIFAIQNQTSTLTVPGILTSPILIYSCSYYWLAAFVASSLVLPFSALAAAVFHRLNKAGDYLGFVSSIARESQFAGVPKGGAGFDGMERARGVRKLRIKLGDVGDASRGVEIGTGVELSVGQMAVGEEVVTKGLDGRRLYI